MPNTIVLTVLKSSNDESNLPGRFVPGAGAGRGSFQLERGQYGYPRRSTLVHALTKWDGDSILNEYDEQTGFGRLVIVDGNAPEPGSVVELQDTITPCEGSSLSLTLGAEGIAALSSYREALERFRTTSPVDMKAWSQGLENCQREGAQLAGWVLEAIQADEVTSGGNPTADVVEEVPQAKQQKSGECADRPAAQKPTAFKYLMKVTVLGVPLPYFLVWMAFFTGYNLIH